jgi:hypothetical protein
MTERINPEAIVNEVVRDPLSFGVPKVVSVAPVSGGVAHYVYRLKTQGGRFYLKVRAEHLPLLPSIGINPRDIVFEYRALLLLGRLLPAYFPEVVYFDPERCFLILTDAMPGERHEGYTLEQLLLEKRVKFSSLYRMGQALRAIHDSAGELSESIRPDDDKEFFKRKLQHRFGFQNNRTINAAIRGLSVEQPRPIILGDPSPKNVGGESVIFFDLEDVHRGCVVFDVGFVIGHLILHAHDDSQRAAAYVARFMQGYRNAHVLEASLTKVIAVGTAMYRLTSIIPYPIDLSKADKATLIKQMGAMLEDLESGETRWAALIDGALTGN